MFSKSDKTRDSFMLHGRLARRGYDWWWHSFTGVNSETGVEKSFFIEFFICNPELGGDRPVFGQTKEKNKPSYLMIKVGTWGEDAKQIHRFFGINNIIIRAYPFQVRADDCYLDDYKTYGSVKCINSNKHPEYMCVDGEFSWNLKINKIIPFNVGYGASSFFRRLNLFEMFWHAEGMKSTYDGEVILDGVHYDVKKDTSYGYADKNWGRDFTSPWVWLSSNNLVSKKTGKKLTNSVFDIGGGCPKVGFVALKRKLLSAIYYEEKCYEFNFSKFWTFTRTKFNCQDTDDKIIWDVEQKNITNKFVCHIECLKKDMLLVNYESPLGIKKHNHLWNGGTGTGYLKLYNRDKLIDEIEILNAGCEYGEFDKEEK